MLELFDQLDSNTIHRLQCIEVSAPGVGTYLQNAKALLKLLHADEAAPTLQIWNALNRVLYSFEEFSPERVLDPLVELGPDRLVRRAWGNDAAEHLGRAKAAAEVLLRTENPLRTVFLSQVSRFVSDPSIRVAIYCRRSSAGDPGLQAVLDAGATTTSSLIHSRSEYQRHPVFDVLVRVGSFQVTGYGSFPDAILFAPRFRQLVQVTWAGGRDASNFPLEPFSDECPLWSANDPESNSTNTLRFASGITWARTVERVGEDGPTIASSETEAPLLERPTAWNDSHELVPAVLAVMGGAVGVLLPPNANHLTFEARMPQGRAAIRPLDERTGSGLWWARLEAVRAPDLSALRAAEGPLARQWKTRLRRALELEPNHIEQRLRREGLRLQTLRQRLREWSLYGATVIAAPQQKRDFEMLMSVLDPWDWDASNADSETRYRITEAAWNEVQTTRSIAIHTGVVEHELISEELVFILEAELDPTVLESLVYPPFRLQMPRQGPLVGYVDLYKVLAVDEGYRCPASQLREVLTLEEAEQWLG